MSADGARDAVRETGRELVLKGLRALLAGDVETWMSLWADEGCMEFPYAPPGMIQRLEGKAAIGAYMRDFPQKLRVTRFSEPTIHQTLEPTVMIVEVACEGTAVSTGRPYPQRYVSVIETRDGRIVNYRDYWNPLVLLQATGQLGALTAAGSPREARP